MLLPWILVFVALGAAILGLSITLKRKEQAHHRHHPVPERDITPPVTGEIHGRMREQNGTYVGPS